jgi:hypothetical protein
MTTVGYTDLFNEVQAGAPIGIESGAYRVLVEATRPRAQSRLLFLDLKIQTPGPNFDKLVQVNLYLPKDDDKPGTRLFFIKKVQGFNLSGETFAQMEAAGDDLERVLTILGTALLNKVVDADIALVTEGKYTGSNELAATKPIDGAAPAAPAAAPAAPVAAPVAAAAPTAPAAAAPVAPAAAAPQAEAVAADADVRF